MGKFDKKSVSNRGGAEASPRGTLQNGNLQSNTEFRKIAPWLLSVKFKKKTLGGLDPLDVWKKIEELNSMYERALIAERARCDMLIERVQKNASAKGLLDNALEGDFNG